MVDQARRIALAAQNRLAQQLLQNRTQTQSPASSIGAGVAQSVAPTPTYTRPVTTPTYSAPAPTPYASTPRPSYTPYTPPVTSPGAAIGAALVQSIAPPPTIPQAYVPFDSNAFNRRPDPFLENTILSRVRDVTSAMSGGSTDFGSRPIPFQEEDITPWTVYEVPGTGPIAAPSNYVVPTEWTPTTTIDQEDQIDNASTSNVSIWNHPEFADIAYDPATRTDSVGITERNEIEQQQQDASTRAIFSGIANATRGGLREVGAQPQEETPQEPQPVAPLPQPESTDTGTFVLARNVESGDTTLIPQDVWASNQDPTAFVVIATNVTPDRAQEILTQMEQREAGEPIVSNVADQQEQSQVIANAQRIREENERRRQQEIRASTIGEMPELQGRSMDTYVIVQNRDGDVTAIPTTAWETGNLGQQGYIPIARDVAPMYVQPTVTAIEQSQQQRDVTGEQADFANVTTPQELEAARERLRQRRINETRGEARELEGIDVNPVILIRDTQTGEYTTVDQASWNNMQQTGRYEQVGPAMSPRDAQVFEQIVTGGDPNKRNTGQEEADQAAAVAGQTGPSYVVFQQGNGEYVAVEVGSDDYDRMINNPGPYTLITDEVNGDQADEIISIFNNRTSDRDITAEQQGQESAVAEYQNSDWVIVRDTQTGETRAVRVGSPTYDQIKSESGPYEVVGDPISSDQAARYNDIVGQMGDRDLDQEQEDQASAVTNAEQTRESYYDFFEQSDGREGGSPYAAGRPGLDFEEGGETVSDIGDAARNVLTGGEGQGEVTRTDRGWQPERDGGTGALLPNIRDLPREVQYPDPSLRDENGQIAPEDDVYTIMVDTRSGRYIVVPSDQAGNMTDLSWAQVVASGLTYTDAVRITNDPRYIAQQDENQTTIGDVIKDIIPGGIDDAIVDKVTDISSGLNTIVTTIQNEVPDNLNDVKNDVIVGINDFAHMANDAVYTTGIVAGQIAEGDYTGAVDTAMTGIVDMGRTIVGDVFMTGIDLADVVLPDGWTDTAIQWPTEQYKSASIRVGMNDGERPSGGSVLDRIFNEIAYGANQLGIVSQAGGFLAGAGSDNGVAYYTPGGLAAWVSDNKEQASSIATQAGGYAGDNGAGDAAIWEAYVGDVTSDRWYGAITRAYLDMIHDPYTYVPAVGAAGRVLGEEGAALRIDPGVGTTTRVIARGAETFGRGLEIISRAIESAGSGGLDYAFEGATRAASAIGDRMPSRTTRVRNAERTADTISDAVGQRGITAETRYDQAGNLVNAQPEVRIVINEDGSRTSAQTPIDSTTIPGQVVNIGDVPSKVNTDRRGAARESTRTAEPTEGDPNRNVSPENVPPRWRPTEDGEDFISVIERERPDIGAELRARMKPIWENEVKVQRRLSPSGVANAESIVASNAVALKTIEVAHEIDPDYTLPRFQTAEEVPSGESLSPVARATERVIRDPWDSSVGERSYLYSGRTTDYPEGAASRIPYTGGGINGSPIRGTKPSTERINAANRYVDVVEEHAAWHPESMSDESFQRAWKQAVALDNQLRENGWRHQIGGTGFSDIGAAPLATLNPSRIMDVDPSLGRSSSLPRRNTVSRIQEANAPASERIPYEQIDEFEGQNELSRNDKRENVGHTYAITDDVSVTVQPISRRDLSPDDMANFPEANTERWYEARINATGENAALDGQYHYAPSESEAVEEAVTAARQQGVDIPEQTIPDESVTESTPEGATPNAESEQTVSAPAEEQLPGAANETLGPVRQAEPEPQTEATVQGNIPEETADAVVERATGAAPTKPDPESFTRTEVTGDTIVSDVEKASGIKEGPRTVRVTDTGRREQVRTIETNEQGAYQLVGDADKNASNGIFSIYRPDGTLIGHGFDLDTAKTIVASDAEIVRASRVKTTSTTIPVLNTRSTTANTNALKTAVRIDGTMIPDAYSLVIDGEGNVWLFNKLLPDEAVVQGTTIRFQNGDTLIDRIVAYDTKLAIDKPKLHSDQRHELAITKAKAALKDEINQVGKEKGMPKRAIDQSLKVVDGYLGVWRDLVLANYLRTVSYPLTQYFGNAANLAITGNWGDLIRVTRESLPFAPSKIKRWANMTPEARVTAAVNEMPSAFRIEHELGLVPRDDVLDSLSRLDIDNVIEKDGYLLPFAQRLIDKNPSNPLRQIVGRSSALVGTKKILKWGNFRDGIARNAVLTSSWMREIRPAIADFKVEVYKAMDNSGITTRAEKNRIWKQFTDSNETGFFSRQKVNDFWGDRLTKGQGIHLSRRWDYHLKDARKRAYSNYERVTLAGKSTKADDIGKRILAFHFYQVRQSSLYVRQALRHPALINMYMNYLEYIENHQEDFPPYVANALKLTTLPGVGMRILINPTGAISFYGGLFEQGGEYSVQDGGWWDRTTKLISDATGFDINSLLGPIPQAIITYSGLSERTPSDITGIKTYLGSIEDIYNGIRYFGYDEPPKSINFLTDAENWLQTQISGLNPFRDDAVENEISAQEAMDQTINMLARDEGRRMGMSDEEIERELRNPDSILYDKAEKRYVLGELITTGIRAAGGGVVRSTTQMESSRGRDLYQDRTKEEKAMDRTTDSYARTIKYQQDDYYEVGTPSQRRMNGIYNEIANGEATRNLTINGVTYTPEEINAMPYEQRRDMATAFLVDYGLMDDHRDYQQQTEDFLANPDNKEFATFKRWQSDVYKYDGGVQGYWEDLIEYNPAARDYYNEVMADKTLTDEAKNRRLASLGAYLYAKGIPSTIYDDPGSTSNVNGIGVADPLNELGQLPTPTEPYVSSYETDLRTGLPELYQDLNTWDQVVDQKMQEYGYAPGTNFSTLPTKTRIAIEDELAAEGYYEPSPSTAVNNYLEWVEVQPEGADVSVDAYLEWDQRDYDSKANDRFVTGQNTPQYNTEPGGEYENAEDLIELLNEHDYKRYP